MDKTTARMTKDLYGYNDYFADELDALIGKRTTELAPLYRRLQKTAVDRLEELNKELETIPEAKRKSKRVQIKMQEQYVAQILPDLELALAAQDPYVTEVLHGTFEYGYYTQAYSLEQATQVAVNVPILNRAGVLGLIANDWVGDGHTYSDRIRASTALVATNAEKTIKNLVTKRLSYNEAANELKDAIGESYNNAIRIVRTEMTRANGLGASYAAMENADILDGKYRDAVRDKRTSGMCAADADYSIKKPYPLDYDTPANPGVPGKRIPNHPNCRCNWRMVLSAIGIRNRSQLARKNDSKESYGERYYTEAKTYDAYAKERGLPSVKEMLEKDNPKRYLRPGETLETLEKELRSVKSGAKNAPLFNLDLDNSGKSSIIKVKGVDNMYSGGLSGALNPNSERAIQHAERYYAEVRKMTTDCKKIAQNTGWKESSITQIKEHLFYKKHDLGGLEAEYFDADYDIAISWQNLIDGRLEEKDLVLLKHEYLELHIMKAKNLPYAEAHKQAEEKHNYGLALKKWRAKL